MYLSSRSGNNVLWLRSSPSTKRFMGIYRCGNTAIISATVFSHTLTDNSCDFSFSTRRSGYRGEKANVFEKPAHELSY